QEKGTVIRVDPPASRDVPAWISAQARALGFTITRPAVELLHGVVGEDTTALTTELEKLAVRVPPGGTVDVGLVEELVSRALPWAAEQAVFELVDAVAEGRRGKAYRELRRLLAAGKPPLLILHM